VDDEQRSMTPALRKVLEFDVALTNEMITFLLTSPVFRSMKNHSKYLEVNRYSVVNLLEFSEMKVFSKTVL
jgi:hypothetical protein